MNQTENKKKLESLKIYSSKYPKAFDFDLHVDDSKGVEIESEKYNFNVLIVAPNDLKWNEKIINKIKMQCSVLAIFEVFANYVRYFAKL